MRENLALSNSTVKIITWNCQMAFRKKAHQVLKLKPDILIVPECEHPDKLVLDSDIPIPSDTLWFGSNLNKGLGVFSYSDYRFKICENHVSEIKIIAPIYVSNGLNDFTLLAIWTNNPTDKDGNYIVQVWKAINKYKELISGTNTILIGDFNSNTIWDKKGKESNHSNVVKILEQLGVSSIYHLYFNQIQGQEGHPTLYLHRRKNRPYHIDYCFASKDISAHILSVEVGTYDDWIKYSDHVPLIVNFRYEKW